MPKHEKHKAKLPGYLQNAASAFTEHKRKSSSRKAKDAAMEESLPPRLLLTTDEACHALNVSKRSLRRLEQRGLLRPSCALRVKLWPVSAIQQFIKSTTL